MSRIRMHSGSEDSDQEPNDRPLGVIGISLTVLLALVLGYGIYFWFVKRVVVNPGEVLVLMKKYGSVSIGNDQTILPKSLASTDAAANEAFDKAYRDANGIFESVYLPGTYFGFGPFDYERFVYKVVEVPSDKVGVVIRKFGDRLPTRSDGSVGRVLAGETAIERGPLPIVLQPGQYPQYSNPFAFEVKLVDPVQIDPGYRGVVTVMAGPAAENPNQYVVAPGEQGVQPKPESEGFVYANPYVHRITPISIRSMRFAMSGAEAIRFPSSDSFEITLEGFVEWAVDEKSLAQTYVQFAEGGELEAILERTIILPYSRSFCRLVGSRYSARDLISGDTKLKFQHEFETALKNEFRDKGIIILQALVRDIIPPEEIKRPINEREVAKQQILTLEQQILVAGSQADLVKQTELSIQNQKIGDAKKAVVTIVKSAEQESDVALTQAAQRLEVARLQLEAAQKQAEALVARGQADATVILLKKQAEAEPLQQQIQAFGGGDAYAQFFFYQKLAPSIKTILTNTDGPFADLFKKFVTPNKTSD